MDWLVSHLLCIRLEIDGILNECAYFKGKIIVIVVIIIIITAAAIINIIVI